MRCQLWVGFWLRLRIARARNEAHAEVSPQAPIPITIKAPPPNGFSAGSDFFDGYYNNHVQKRSTDEELPISDRVARSADDKLYEPVDTISTSKHLANMFRSLAEAADSFDR